jgi:Flp pilus assembly protein TadG
MRSGISFQSSRGLRSERGGVAVEFAILLPVFLLLVFGIIDFAHALYMQQVITSASREGARYATKYHTNNSGNRILPSALSPTISNYIIKTSAENGGAGGYGLDHLLASDASPTVIDYTNATISPGYTTGNPGDDITVTVRATKNWFVINRLIPTLDTHIDITASTVMKCE